MAGNTNLKNANKAKNDEFYTQLVDIENELKHYKRHFKDKIVFCNCDDPYESNFFKYFAMNFNHLGLKKLICASYDSSPVAYTQLALFDDIPTKTSVNNNRKAYKIEITEVCDYNNDGAVDLTDIQTLLKNNKNTLSKLKGNGDFRSEESIELLKQADIVVTNPPFSLFREYVAQLVEYDKKFLIIGNKNAITYKEFFSLLKENKVWIGYAQPSKFLNCVGTITNQVQGLCRWFTNLDISKRYEKLTLYKSYNQEEYPKYDNYDAINVDKVTDIPYDYYDVMGVPITFLDKYNPEQFELLGITDRQNTSGLRTKKYTDLDSPKYNDLNARSVLKIGNEYKQIYARILIRRRNNGD